MSSPDIPSGVRWGTGIAIPAQTGVGPSTPGASTGHMADGGGSCFLAVAEALQHVGLPLPGCGNSCLHINPSRDPPKS